MAHIFIKQACESVNPSTECCFTITPAFGALASELKSITVTCANPRSGKIAVTKTVKNRNKGRIFFIEIGVKGIGNS